jgi:hypothetical protein
MHILLSFEKNFAKNIRSYTQHYLKIDRTAHQIDQYLFYIYNAC